MRYLKYQRSNGIQFHGGERLCHTTAAAKVHVYSVSVLCLGKLHEHPQSIEAWKQKLEWFTKCPETLFWKELPEDQSSSSGKISQDRQYWCCFVKSKGRRQRTGSNMSSPKIGRCTTTSIGPRMETNKRVFRNV